MTQFRSLTAARSLFVCALLAMLTQAGCSTVAGDDASPNAILDTSTTEVSIEPEAPIVGVFYGATVEDVCLTPYVPGSRLPSPESFARLPSPAGDGEICVGPTSLTSSAVEQVTAKTDERGQGSINLVFHPGAQGIDKFNALATICFTRTDACPSQRAAIVLNGKVLSAATIQSASFDRDQIRVSGTFSPAEADEIARTIQSAIASNTSSLEFRPVVLDLGP